MLGENIKRINKDYCLPAIGYSGNKILKLKDLWQNQYFSSFFAIPLEILS